MATRAEQAHAEAQRTGRAKRAAAGSGRSRTRKTGHVEAKATQPREPRSASGRASRKSTRSGANRAKSTSPAEIREGIQKGSPEAKARRSSARAKRVRGHGA